MCKRWGGKGHILGEYVCGFNARDEDQDQISPPPWSLVISYKKAIWKEATTRTTVGIYFLPSTTLRESWGGELQRREQDQEVPCLWASEISFQRGWDCELRLINVEGAVYYNCGEAQERRTEEDPVQKSELKMEELWATDGGPVWELAESAQRGNQRGCGRKRGRVLPWTLGTWVERKGQDAGARHEGRKWPKGELFRWRSSGLHRWRQGRPQERMGRNECRKFSIRMLLASLMFVVIWQAEVWRSLQRRWFRWKNTSWLTERDGKGSKGKGQTKAWIVSLTCVKVNHPFFQREHQKRKLDKADSEADIQRYKTMEIWPIGLSRRGCPVHQWGAVTL